MSQVFHSKKVLITGAYGFTGQHLTPYLKEQGYKVFSLKADLLDKPALLDEISNIEPEYVVHLAAISFVAETDIDAIYKVNITGSLNLLDALVSYSSRPEKVILASSAAVYGKQVATVLNESLCPSPVDHYGCSKLAMEHLSRNYNSYFPIVITRPFNYTGLGHADSFLIPKIIKAYKQRQNCIELGSLDVSREFNDVRDICNIYHRLLTEMTGSMFCNICSSQTVSLMEIIQTMNNLSGYELEVKVNPELVRENEIKDLSGDVTKLNSIIDYKFEYSLMDTLQWMYKC